MQGAKEVQGANFRLQAAINGYENINNVVAKYSTEPNSLTGARSGPIPQDCSIGGGLPSSLVTDGAVSESKLDDGRKAKVNAQGSQGPAGAAGPSGPPGPTEGDSDAIFVPDPLPSSTTDLPDVDDPMPTVNTTVSGRLFVFVSFRVGADCAAGDPVAWIDLDGVPIEPSYRRLTQAPAAAQPASVAGVTNSEVAPGSRQITVAIGCTSGLSPSGSFDNQLSASTIVLG